MNQSTLRATGGRDPRSGTNSPMMADYNQRVILDTIRRTSEGMSRVELSALTGLSAQTISNVCRRLLDDDLIAEVGKAGEGPGKPRTILRVNPRRLYAVGVHLDPVVTTFVVLDLNGEIVARSRRQTPADSEPDGVIATIAKEIERLVEMSGVNRDNVVGLGVAAPGPLEAETGTIVEPPLLSGWHRVPLGEALSQATGYSVLVDKDVTAAAVAEMWAGDHSDRGSFVFFYIGTGIGAGIVLDGQIHRGGSANAGEIGHMVADSDGPPCSCGQRGCIAVTCTPQAMVAEAERAGLLTGTGAHAAALQAEFRSLCDMADAGDASATKIIEASVDHVARAVSVMTHLLDVDRVVFGGPFWPRLARHYLQRLPPLLREFTVAGHVRDTRVAGSTVGYDVGAVGAACVMLEQSLAPSTDRLFLRA